MRHHRQPDRVGILNSAALAVVAAMLLPAAARAQVATAAAPVLGPVETTRPFEDLDTLTAHFNAGRWAPLGALAADILDSIRDRHAGVRDAIDPDRHHIVMHWIGADTFGTPMLMRVVVHRPRPAVDSPDLPGLTGVHEVLLSHSREGQLASLYTSTRAKDPVAEALPGFVQALAGPLFGRVGVLAGSENAGPPTTLWATVTRVGLPFRRATVKVKAVAADPWLDIAAFGESLRALATRVGFDDVPNSACARGHAEALAQALTTAAGESCQAATWDHAHCRAALDRALADAFAAQTCGKPSLPGEERSPVALVDKRFRALVAGSLSNSATAELTFRNRPLTRFAFGAGTAVIADARLSHPRVKLDRGNLVGDPLSRVLTMLFVNVSPRGYDADADRMSAHERVRLFAGAALTPDFGVAGGVNVLMARGIGLSAGVAVLFARGAEAGEVGQPPADSKDPFRLSVATAPFVGITYNYK